MLLLEGEWNDVFMDELEGFPDALHDDQVDAASDAFSMVARMNNTQLPEIDGALMKESYWT